METFWYHCLKESQHPSKALREQDVNFHFVKSHWSCVCFSITATVVTPINIPSIFITSPWSCDTIHQITITARILRGGPQWGQVTSGAWDRSQEQRGQVRNACSGERWEVLRTNFPFGKEQCQTRSPRTFHHSSGAGRFQISHAFCKRLALFSLARGTQRSGEDPVLKGSETWVGILALPLSSSCPWASQLHSPSIIISALKWRC